MTGTFQRSRHSLGLSKRWLSQALYGGVTKLQCSFKQSHHQCAKDLCQLSSSSAAETAAAGAYFGRLILHAA